MALTTLNRIEEAMRRGLTYLAAANDSYSRMSQTELREQLKLKAESIRDGYRSKSQQISCVRRFFGNVAQKEQAIESAYERIENLATPPPVLDLPNELIQHICGFLQAGDLGKLAQVNKHADNHVKQVEVQRAREYGYTGRDLAEAKDYLKNLFEAVDTLVKDKFIPDEYIVRRGRWPFWRYVDSEATLRNIKHLNGDQEAALKIKLNEALLRYSEDGNAAACKALLQLGADIEARNQDGHTPLILSAKLGRIGVAKLLIEQGADVNSSSLNGSAPLVFAVAYSKSLEISRLILENGGATSINQLSNTGHTALHISAQGGLEEITKLLIEWGADCNLLNAQGKTALELTNNRVIKNLLQ